MKTQEQKINAFISERNYQVWFYSVQELGEERF